MAGVDIGGYRILELLGRGTMGAVYRAQSVALPELVVAIKRVASLGSDEDHARLRREAETMARLAHTNIVRILEVIDDGADLALVMEYAPGGSLSARMKTGPLRPVEVVGTLAPIADALTIAHAEGVLHRDVKPSNILFAADGRPLLADFGIALASGQASLTGTGSALGTAAYLAPELVRADQPTAASDVYALGVVAYEALAGRPPYQAANPLAVVVAADGGVHARLDPGTLGPLADIVERAMARDPMDRYATMADFALALRSVRPPEVAADAARTLPPPVPAQETTLFGATSSPASANAAAAARADAERKRGRRLVPAAVAVLAIIGGAVGLLATRDRGSNGAVKARVYTRPPCNAAETVQCVEKIARTTKGVRVTFPGADPVEYAFGTPDDVPLVANWFCGAHETLAVYRPSTGALYYFDGWPDPNEAGNAPVAYGDATGIRDARPTIGFRNDDKCADVRLAADGQATWFEPAVQPGRLAVLSRP